MNTTHSFSFADISKRSNRFKFINHQTGVVNTCAVALDDTAFAHSGRTTSSLIADLLDIAATISSADRLVVEHDDNPAVIEVSVPVRHPEIFQQRLVTEALTDVLYWYTNNHWCFTFTKRKSSGRASESQKSLFPSQKSSTCLWSAGLDAYAGAYNFLRNSNARLSLVGVSTSNIVHKALLTSNESLSAIYPSRIDLIRTPIRVTNTIDLTKNSLQRARGLVFILVGTAYSLVNESKELSVFENGYGALNLPFSSSQLGLDHARSVHPVSVLKINHLLTQLFGDKVRVTNPCVFSTKSEMCKSIIDDGNQNAIFSTFSCDRRRREKPSQCGMCSSCLLRQLAIVTNGVVDTSDYVAQHYRDTDKPVDSSHFDAMQFQASMMRQALSNSDPWDNLLECYETLSDTGHALSSMTKIPLTEIQSRLVRMYKRHADQWFAHSAQLTGSTRI